MKTCNFTYAVKLRIVFVLNFLARTPGYAYKYIAVSMFRAAAYLSSKTLSRITNSYAAMRNSFLYYT